MSVKFEFFLSDNDYERLYCIKRSQGKSDMTGNEFARELLESQIHRLHPAKVIIEED